MPEPDKCSHLVQVMQSDNTHRVAENAVGNGSRFDEVLDQLEEAFSRPALVHPTYVLPLLKLPIFTYDYHGLDEFRTSAKSSIAGLKSCSGYTASQLLAAIYRTAFDSIMSEEWAKEASKRGELPDLEDLVKFFWKRQSAMNALVPVNTAPKKSMSTRPQHVKSAALSKAVHHVSSSSSSRFNCPARN